jgi:hypothetical protein
LRHRSRRQKEQLGAGVSDALAYLFTFVTAEIVEDDDVSGTQGGHQHHIDIGQEVDSVDRSVEDARRGDAIAAQGGQKSQRPPVPMGRLADQPLPACSPAAQRRHVGRNPGLIDEYEALGRDPGLIAAPLTASARHLGAVLLGRERSLF